MSQPYKPFQLRSCEASILPPEGWYPNGFGHLDKSLKLTQAPRAPLHTVQVIQNASVGLSMDRNFSQGRNVFFVPPFFVNTKPLFPLPPQATLEKSGILAFQQGFNFCEEDQKSATRIPPETNRSNHGAVASSPFSGCWRKHLGDPDEITNEAWATSDGKKTVSWFRSSVRWYQRNGRSREWQNPPPQG